VAGAFQSNAFQSDAFQEDAGNNVTRTATDSLTASQSATRSASLHRTVSQTVTTSDVAVINQVARTTTEAISTSDVAIRSRGQSRTATQATVFAVDVARRTAVLHRSATEAISTSDTVVRGYVLSTTDHVVASGIATRTAILHRTTSDSVSATDAAIQHSTPTTTGPAIFIDGANVVEILGAGAVLFETARFMSAVNGVPGEASIRVRDDLGVLSYVPGQSLELIINGGRVWTGFVTNVKRVYAFPALNVDDFGPTRFFDIVGTDLNTLFARRIVFNQSDPANVLAPLYPPFTPDVTAIGDLFAGWLDLTGDGLDTSTGVEAVARINEDQQARAWEGSDTWGQAMQSITALPASIYYIRPNWEFAYVDADTPDAPFGLSDVPDGVTTKGYREMEVLFDGTNLANDVLAWGAGYGSNVPVFTRAQDATSQTEHGLWQLGQTTFGVYKQSTINRIADSILNGSPEHHRGAKDDRIAVTLVTFEDGLLPAQKVAFTSEVFGYDTVIPIRKMEVTFPAPDVPRYELTLSHEIDVPWSFFDPFRWKLPALPGISLGSIVPPNTTVPPSYVCTDFSNVFDTFDDRFLPLTNGVVSPGNAAWGSTSLNGFQWHTIAGNTPQLFGVINGSGVMEDTAYGTAGVPSESFGARLTSGPAMGSSDWFITIKYQFPIAPTPTSGTAREQFSLIMDGPTSPTVKNDSNIGTCPVNSPGGEWMVYKLSWEPSHSRVRTKRWAWVDVEPDAWDVTTPVSIDMTINRVVITGPTGISTNSGGGLVPQPEVPRVNIDWVDFNGNGPTNCTYTAPGPVSGGGFTEILRHLSDTLMQLTRTVATGSLKLSVGGSLLAENTDYTVDTSTGVVTLATPISDTTTVSATYTATGPLPPVFATGAIAFFPGTGPNTEAAFLSLFGNMAYDIIEMQDGQYDNWQLDIKNVSRAARPLTIRPASGANVVWDGSGLGAGTNGPFNFNALPGPGTPGFVMDYITFDPAGTGGSFTIQNYHIGSFGLILTGWVDHMTLNGFNIVNCSGVASQNQSHCLYVNSDLVHHGTNLTANDWTVVGDGARTLNGLQTFHNPNISGLTANNWTVSNLHRWAYIWGDATGVTMSGWNGTNCDATVDAIVDLPNNNASGVVSGSNGHGSCGPLSRGTYNSGGNFWSSAGNVLDGGGNTA
jgi:hypothetical protein